MTYIEGIYSSEVKNSRIKSSMLKLEEDIREGGSF